MTKNQLANYVATSQLYSYSYIQLQLYSSYEASCIMRQLAIMYTIKTASYVMMIRYVLASHKQLQIYHALQLLFTMYPNRHATSPASSSNSVIHTASHSQDIASYSHSQLHFETLQHTYLTSFIQLLMLISLGMLVFIIVGIDMKNWQPNLGFRTDNKPVCRKLARNRKTNCTYSYHLQPQCRVHP